MAKVRERLKERARTLGKAIADMDRQFGKGTVMRLGDRTVEPVSVFSTGSIGLDHALGVGGLPRGRIVEIFGPEASGKTTLTLQAIAEMQRAGGTAAFVDAEHALDVPYAARLGIDVNELLIAQPDTGEQALEVVEGLARSGGVDLIVVDSVAALTPKAEIEGQMGDSHVGLQARLMSQALRKITAVTFRENVTVIFINQLRMKIGVMFGNPETTTGGNALKFYASVRLDIRRQGAIKRGDEVIGNQAKVKVVKNKVAPPFREARFDIIYGRGIDRITELVGIGVEHGVIDKSGAWYAWEGDRLGQGRDNVRETLAGDPERLARLEAAVREALRGDDDPLGLGAEGAPAAGADRGGGADDGAAKAAGSTDGATGATGAADAVEEAA